MKYLGILPREYRADIIVYVLLSYIRIIGSAPVVQEDDFDTEPSLRSGLVIDHWNDSLEVNPDELGYYFQGDIITTSTDLRSIATNESLRWPQGIVPYVITGPYNDEGLQILEWAMNEYHQKTCIRFKLRQPYDRDYLNITNDFTGCWSALGRQGGKQIINLQHPGCLNADRRGTAIHELMHALGIKHEHTRIDRDQYIDILSDNIAPQRSVNFIKSTVEEATNYDIPYDFESVMHYSMFAFSTDYARKPTITPRNPRDLIKPDGTRIKMGQRRGFGENDIKKLNRMYCPELGPNLEPAEKVSLLKHVAEAVEAATIADWWTRVIQNIQQSFY